MRQPVNWSAYAGAYDLMAQHNPAYRELLEDFEDQLGHWDVREGSLILDVGGGTGNFSCLAADRLPGSRVVLADASREMLGEATRKARTRGLDNLELLHVDLEATHFEPGSIDYAVCVHTLYTLNRPLELLERIHEWLRPGGAFYVCDVGRVIDTGDWARFLFRELQPRLGLARALHLFWRGRPVATANRHIAAAQRRGCYWVHRPGEFARALRKVGFRSDRQRLAYRGISDLVVCHKP